MLNNLPLSALHADPRNANVCTPETEEKIRRHIQRTGLCPHLIVRPHPNQPGEYLILDGHHRHRILQRLGWHSVDCQVWDIDDKEAAMALATLNRLRGEDDYHQRAKLLDELCRHFAKDDLSALLPETSDQIEEMLAMLHLDMDALTEECQRQIEVEKATLPVPLTFLVSPDDARTVETALAQFLSPTGDRSQALVALCQQSLQTQAVESLETSVNAPEFSGQDRP